MKTRVEVARMKALGGVRFTKLLQQWRLEAAIAQKWECYYCHIDFRVAFVELTGDHLIDLADGGEHRRTNIVAACGRCNLRKKDLLSGRIPFL